MKDLGQIQLTSQSSLVHVRNKIKDLTEDLKFDDINSTRISTISSELIRQLMVSGEQATITFSIGGKEGVEQLIMKFTSQNPQILEKKAMACSFFDEIDDNQEEDGQYCLKVYKQLPGSIQQYPDSFFHQQKEKIERLSHDELLQHLKKANKELELHKQELRELNTNLEGIVQKQTAELKKLLYQKTGFIVQLGHDLGTPIGPIINLIPLILKKEQDEKIKEMLTIIQKNSTVLYNVVKKTVKFAQVTSHDFNPKIQELPISECVNSIIEEKNAEITPNQIAIDNQIDKQFTLLTDENYFHYIINELITNAIKFSPDGGTITIAYTSNQDEATFLVKDEGIGISSTHIDHVFDEFYKTDESRHDLSSNGMGLTIAKIIVERFGGRMWAESPGEQKGSTFSFSLPQHPKDCFTQNNDHLTPMQISSVLTKDT